MLLRLLKFVEYVWVGFGFLCAYQLYATWGVDDQLSYIYGGGFIVSIFMFFFRRYSRGRYEQIQAEKNKQQDS